MQPWPPCIGDKSDTRRFTNFQTFALTRFLTLDARQLQNCRVIRNQMVVWPSWRLLSAWFMLQGQPICISNILKEKNPRKSCKVFAIFSRWFTDAVDSDIRHRSAPSRVGWITVVMMVMVKMMVERIFKRNAKLNCDHVTETGSPPPPPSPLSSPQKYLVKRK